MKSAVWNLTLGVFLVLLDRGAAGQTNRSGIRVESITFSGSFVHNVGLKPGEGLNGVRGFGGGVQVHFRLTPAFFLRAASGYADLEVDQDDAVNRWRWGFWDRFYREYVRDLQQRDPNYVATFTPMQRLHFIAAHLTAEMRLPLHIGIKPYLTCGVSLYRYERTLTLHERWRKRFPELNYTYEYEYDNHAEDRLGTLFGVLGGIGGRIHLYRFVEIDLQGRYHRILTRWSRHEAYQYFPMKNFTDVSLGVVFMY
ncbi:MAG: hypothetical protein ACUVTG_09430 [Candidatus Oleimicrobiaceae bacterium]